MQESVILRSTDTDEVDLVALEAALHKYEGLKARGQVDPEKICEGAYIRALYREEVRNKKAFAYTMGLSKRKAPTAAVTAYECK